ncbi:transposase [Hymenobacter arcticus]
MIITVHLCGRCSSEHVRKNGSNSGRAKYQCTACGYQGYLQPAAPARAASYAQVEKLLAERNSQRSTVRATGVSRMTVAKLAKKSCASVPGPTAPATQKSPTQALGSA